jgi:hypothetical protein
MAIRMEHNRYIGPTTKFKESFGFLQQKLPASRVNFVPCLEEAEVSDSAKYNGPAGVIQKMAFQQKGVENIAAQLQLTDLARPSSRTLHK